jgi:NTE family protein
MVFRSGNTGLAVRASAAIPNVFEPVVIGKQTYVDGGLSSPVPVSALKEMGANFVIAVDISAKPTAEKSSGFFAVFDQTFNIMSLSALKQELAQADVVIRPNVLSHSSTDFDDREKSILEGEQITQSQMVAIKKAIAAKQAMLSR